MKQRITPNYLKTLMVFFAVTFCFTAMAQKKSFFKRDTISKTQLALKVDSIINKKWKHSGIRLDLQDFGILEQFNPKDTCNCSESRTLLERANFTISISSYKNLNKRWALSGDIGISHGYVGRLTDTPTIEKYTMLTIRADAYYHFTANNFQLQPYLFLGLHSHFRRGWYGSLPVGVGTRYLFLNKKGLLTLQTGYGIRVSSNISKSIVSSLGFYYKINTKPSRVIRDTIRVVIGDRDSDGVPDNIDKCPDCPGVARLQGCPINDRDGDGVTDDKDKCPDVAGDIKNLGCPQGERKDKDGDGIWDDEDKCPDVKGLAKYDGCPAPDRDDDGVIDDEDKCPDQKGKAKYNGCPVPDRDGDGVTDEEDKCPDVKGEVKNQGCPVADRDGDGIPDNEDKCPDVKGYLKYSGCPPSDTDGDGIIDDEDNCPTVKGLVSNKGCPEAVKEKNILEDTINHIIYFDFDKYSLTKRAAKTLDSVVAHLRQNPGRRVHLYGHTDLHGSVEYNRYLSKARVYIAKTYLISKGILADRIETSYHEKSAPVLQTMDIPRGILNRRVEIRFRN